MNEIKIPETKVKFKDVFHLKNLYIMMHEYLLEEKWFGEEGPQPASPDKQHRYIEDLYLEKFCQKGLHAGGKEMWIYWRIFKKPEGKHSGYIRYRMNIDFHGVYIQNREIMNQGKKLKVQFGELEIMFNGAVQTDYDNKWGMKPFFYFAKQMANKYLWKGKIETNESEIVLMLETRADKFDDIEKAVIELHSYETPLVFSTSIDRINKGAAYWIDTEVE